MFVLAPVNASVFLNRVRQITSSKLSLAEGTKSQILKCFPTQMGNKGAEHQQVPVWSLGGKRQLG